MRKSLAVCLAIAFLCLGVASLAVADTLGYYVQGGTVDLAGPAYDWWYGCSPTSAGMMLGYYDIHGYGGKSYANLVPGGTAESKTFPGSSSVLTNTYKVNDIIASHGYVTDFYRFADGTPNYTNGGSGSGSAYGISGDDNTSNFHTFNCLADFMGTSQSALGNVNGGTIFYSFLDGTRFYVRDAVNYGVSNKDGMYGMDEYFHYCGYAKGININNDTDFFTQRIYNNSSAPNGFTFADYKAEIDAGRVMMIQVTNHSMFGYGYKDDSTGQWILFRNTWDDLEHSMLWGGTYTDYGYTLTQWGVVGFEPTGGSPVPLPGAVWLLESGLLGLIGASRRWRRS